MDRPDLEIALSPVAATFRVAVLACAFWSAMPIFAHAGESEPGGGVDWRTEQLPAIQPAPYPEEDLRACQVEIRDDSFAGCDRAIASGKLNSQDLITAYVNRGKGWWGKGELGRALADLDQAIRLDPKDQRAYVIKARLLLERKDPSAALAVADQAIKVKPNSLAYATRGQVLQALGRRDEAVASYKRALSKGPGLEEQLIAEQGLAAINAAASKPADTPKPLPSIAGRDPSPTRTAPPQENAAADAAKCRSGTNDELIPVCDRAIGSGKFKGPELSLLLTFRCADRLLKKDYDRALADCSDAIRTDPNQAYAYMSKARALLGKSDPRAAIVEANEGVRLAPDEALARTVRGDVEKALGRVDEAREDYEKVMAKGADGAARQVAQAGLEALSSASGDRQDANLDADPAGDLRNCNNLEFSGRALLAVCGRVIASKKVTGKDLEQLYDLHASLAAKAADFNLAIADYTALLALNPEFPKAARRRADAYLEVGEYDKAIADYDQALRRNPNDTEAYILRGNAYLAKGDYDRAIAAYSAEISAIEHVFVGKLAKVDRDRWSELLINRGVAYLRKSDADRAVADFSAAIDLDDTRAEAFVDRGMAYDAKQRPDLAMADFNRALKLQPSNSKFLTARGDSFWSHGRRDDAIADYNTALNLRLSPGETRNVQEAFAKLDSDYRQCHAQSADATIVACGNVIAWHKFTGAALADLYDQRGAQYHQKAQYELAIADFDQALALNPADADARLGRGSAYFAKQDYDRAIADYSEVLKWIDEVRASPLNKVLPLINRGAAYFQKNDLERAIADYSTAINIDRTSARALMYRGIAYDTQQSHDLALADFGEAIRLQPKNPSFLIMRGNSLWPRGRRDAAIADYNTALNLDLGISDAKDVQEAFSKLDDDYKQCHAEARDTSIAACGKVIAWHKFTGAALADLYDQRGAQYYEKALYELALADLDEAIRINPLSYLAFLDRGFTHWAMKNTDRAIADFSEMIKLDPAANGGYVHRGRVYASIGDHDHAIADFSAAIRIRPGDAATYVLRGDILRKAGRPEEALADYQKALSLEADAKTKQAAQAGIAALSVKPAADEDTARCRSQSGDAAIAACGRAISTGKLSGAALADAYNRRGGHYYDKGQYDLALADIDRAIQLDPSSATAYLNRGFVDLAKKDSGRAIADFSEVIRLRPNAALPYFHRGSVHAATGDHARAITDFSEAIRLDSKFGRAYCKRGDAYVATQDLRKAFDDYSRAVHLDPKYVIEAATAAIGSGKRTGDTLAMTYAVRANGYSEIHDYDRAIADLTEEIRIDPQDASAYGQRGTAQSRKGRYDEALADYSKAISIDPSDADDLLLRGEIYHSIKHDIDRAIADFSAAIKIDPKFFAALTDRGYAYLDKGAHDQAVADFDAAIALRPTAGGPHAGKAEALLAKKKPADALVEANEAVRLNPDEDEAYVVRGNVFRILGRASEARADYEKALTIDQDNQAAAEGLKKLGSTN